jgi:hypothetical protein
MRRKNNGANLTIENLRRYWEIPFAFFVFTLAGFVGDVSISPLQHWFIYAKIGKSSLVCDFRRKRHMTKKPHPGAGEHGRQPQPRSPDASLPGL